MDLTDTTGTASRFQHYELLRRTDGSPWELGRGTMGVTYKAFDVNLRCEVALKVVNPALIHHPHARERFIREARAAAKLRHRNIASVYHLGSDGERFFYAMEFIDGETLDALVRRQGPLSPDAALRVLLQVARALAAASRQGVIHRDIKPGNLMVVHEDDDDHRVVKLIDFGLARAVTADDDAGNLTANGFVGTPVYSSPEQMAEKPADARSDIYSLGVTAWFLLVGRPPFSGTVASIFQQHATKQPPWEALPATVPAPVRALLRRMLEKNPARRPQSAVELRQEIDACRERMAAAGIPTRPDTAVGNAPEKSLAPGQSAPPAPIRRELGPGVILKGRYELVRLAGEGNSGQVFEARDRAAGNEARALKVFRAELTDNTSKREIVAEEVRLIQAAPHPNLIRLHAFDRLGSRSLDFLVEEWLRGFTLLELLAVRGGALPVPDALQMLAQAAAAVDHATDREMDRLDLALHQLHIHFPKLTGDEAETRALMAAPLTTWPPWVLKVNPLGAIHGGLESSTWAGELTHLPGATPALDRDLHLDDRPDTSAGSYLRGLARTVYETLGGAPGMIDPTQDKRSKFASLPVLGEAANAVLQRALCDEPASLASSRDFYAALASATGQKVVPAATDSPDRKTPLAAGLPRNPRPPPPIPVRRETVGEGPSALAGVAVPANERDSFAAQSSLADRLMLASGGTRRLRGWLPVVAVAGLLGLALGAVVFAATTHRFQRAKASPSHVVNATAQKPASFAHPVSSAPPMSVRSSPPAQPIVNTLAAHKDEATPNPGAASLTPAVPTTTPPPLSTTLATRETSVKVRLETRPTGAEIRMAGKLLGTTPLEVTLPPGEHQLIAHYHNWPEVHHTLHLDADQLTALEEIHMIPPSLVPAAEPSPTPVAKNRHPATSPTPRRDAGRPSPTPTANAIVHFPSPAAGAAPVARGPEPFLAQPTPPRKIRTGPPAPDQEATADAPPRRRPPEPPPLQSDDGDD